MGAARHALAIDLGTSGPKVAVIDESGTVVDHEFRPTPQTLLPGGGAEQAPEDWWRAIVAAAGAVLGRQTELRSSIVAIGVTSQWSGTVAVDRAGEPLHPALIWMDSRGAPHTRALVGGAVRIQGYSPGKILHWIRLTGGAPGLSGKDSLSHILFLKNERPDIYERTYKLLEPKDYLNLKLTGEFTATIDSIALYWTTDNRNIDKVRYHPKLLALAGLDREKLPELKLATDVVGKLKSDVAEELGLEPGLPVIGGAPDVHAAAIGAGTLEPGELHLYVGTSSWLSCHHDRKQTDLDHNMAALPASLPGRYILLNEQQTSGACLGYLRDQLLCRDDALTPGPASADAFRLFDELAEKAPPGSDGLLFTPWLYGERTPVEDATLRGGFHNLSLSHAREHWVRAVFEGVALNARWLLEAVDKFLGKKRAPQIRIIGGGAKSDVWCQIYADALGAPIWRVQDPYLSTIRGAGVLALAATSGGEIGRTAVELGARIAVERRFEPRPTEVNLYNRLYREFLGLYDRNRSMFARMNQGASESP